MKYLMEAKEYNDAIEGSRAEGRRVGRHDLTFALLSLIRTGTIGVPPDAPQSEKDLVTTIRVLRNRPKPEGEIL